MNNRTRVAGIGLMAALLLPQTGQAAALQTAAPAQGSHAEGWISRGGGGARGGGARGGGGSVRGGGGGHSGGSRGGADRMRAQTGFQGASSSLNRGDRRPSGGWSTSVPASGARPSLDRSAGRDLNRTGGSRDLSRPDLNRSDLNRGNLNRSDLSRTDVNRDLNRDLNRNINRDVNRDINRDINRTVNRNWTRNVNIGDVNIHPGWARPGWGVARPWGWGWYGGWSNPPWGWWGARAAVWGIGTLATASLINSAVDAAIDNQVSTIVVPNTSYQLLFGSVAPSGDGSVTFAVTADGSTYQLSADCRAGTINGQDPASAAEAELLNAACQVAYGST